MKMFFSEGSYAARLSKRLGQVNLYFNSDVCEGIPL